MERTAGYGERFERSLREEGRSHGFDGTDEEFGDWQSDTRERLESVLGIPRIRQRAVAPRARRLATRDAGDHVRETWTVRTEPDLAVPFYVLLPSSADPPYPVVVALHGHADAGKDLTVGAVEDQTPVDEQRRDIGRQAVRRGYAVIAPDLRGFGDLTGPEPDADGYRRCTTMQKHAQLLGRTLLGERVWDVTRLLSVVTDRPELDGDRIGIAGHSGGGAVALFAAALEDRLSPVAVSGFFCAFEDSIVATDHCECNYVPGLLALGEVWDVAGLVAPRPLLVSAGEADHLFPVDGVERAFAELERIYRAAGRPDRCRLAIGPGGHRVHPDHVWSFVDEHR
ncbi:MAG: alpha/beta hydrolase family protein [Haloarculaceae archaeon]